MKKRAKRQTTTDRRLASLRRERDRNAALTAALKPFAIAANTFDDTYQDEDHVGEFFTVGDLRRARAAIAFTRKRSDRRPAR